MEQCVKRRDPTEQVPDSTIAAAEEPAGGVEQRCAQAKASLDEVAQAIGDGFKTGKRVLSFDEYLDQFAAHPVRHGRSAPQYVRDMFRFYGTEELERPWGTDVRFKLFDCTYEPAEIAGREPSLVGHERLQGELYRALCNFAREGRANRLVLMHGPNGSAKSTVASCVLRALEHYSTQPEGALYRFHWIFPTRKTSRGAIGFGGGEAAQELDSYAHLDDADIDARLVMELRDHPLFLMPAPLRRPLIEKLWQQAGAVGSAPDWLRTGELSHKNKQIYEALLSSCGGDYRQVLRHVQVERYFISRRYRVGAVTLGPEMSVDARERQVTADRSLSALPTSLQAMTMFEAHGELVEASGGVLEFSDLLKRPIDAFRYLQLTLETGQVALSQQTIFTNVVMLGSANEIHLAAFREHPEYASFRGRIEPMRVAYLRNYLVEEQIYETQILPQLRRHVAPHTARVAAELAVLSRLRRPDSERYEKPLSEIVDSLTVVEKMVLYSDGEPPARLSNDERKLLKANIHKLYDERDADQDYEGRVGISPRTMRTLLLDAAQSADYACVSPFAALACMDELCKRKAEFEWIKLKPVSGGYHDHKHFREQVRSRLMDRIEADLRGASGFIETDRYDELFARYISNVSSWVKGEKIRNTLTGKDEDPDERMMAEVEGLLGVDSDAKDHRHTIMSMIAAQVIDHPDDEPLHSEIFPGYVDKLQTAAFDKLRKPFAMLLRHVIRLLRDGGGGLEDADRKDAEQFVERLRGRGYNEESGKDAASALLRDRYSDIVG